MQTALPNASGPIFQLNEKILAEGIAASAASPRKRMILPLHRKQEATVQRMLNFFQPGTYVRPHNHPQEGAIEGIMVIRGALGFVVFDEAGEVVSTHRLEAGGLGLIDVEPKVWHGMAALEPDTVILEVKQGPYDVQLDKEFATWAPEEEAPGYEDVVRKIEGLFL